MNPNGNEFNKKYVTHKMRIPKYFFKKEVK